MDNDVPLLESVADRRDVACVALKLDYDLHLRTGLKVLKGIGVGGQGGPRANLSLVGAEDAGFGVCIDFAVVARTLSCEREHDGAQQGGFSTAVAALKMPTF